MTLKEAKTEGLAVFFFTTRETAEEYGRTRDHFLEVFEEEVVLGKMRFSMFCAVFSPRSRPVVTVVA